MSRPSGSKNTIPAFRKRWLPKAQPADVAKTCLFLSSDLGAYLNGVDIAVHGGGEYPGRYLLTRDQGE